MTRVRGCTTTAIIANTFRRNRPAVANITSTVAGKQSPTAVEHSIDYETELERSPAGTLL